MSKYISNESVNNMAMKLRKAAMKARHEKELNDLRTRMQKEIDQTINELKMSSDIRRMQAIETQVIGLFFLILFLPFIRTWSHPLMHAANRCPVFVFSISHKLVVGDILNMVVKIRLETGKTGKYGFRNTFPTYGF